MPKFTQRFIEHPNQEGHYTVVLDYAPGSKPPLDPPVWSSWVDNNPSLDFLGFIPLFLDYMDERPASEQFDESYSHAGGWLPIDGFARHGVSIQFRGDPALHPLASTSLRHEDIFFYSHGWVMILNTLTDEYEVARLS